MRSESAISPKSNPGSLSAPLIEQPSHLTLENKTTISGHILFHEKFGGETLVWAGGLFYRILDCPKDLYNLTPITLIPSDIANRETSNLLADGDACRSHLRRRQNRAFH